MNPTIFYYHYKSKIRHFFVKLHWQPVFFANIEFFFIRLTYLLGRKYFTDAILENCLNNH